MVHPRQYVQHLKVELEQALDTAFVNVFVMGPGLAKVQGRVPWLPAFLRPKTESPAGVLRRELVQRCKNYGYSALMEHGEIIDAVRSSRAGKGSDLAYIEEVHADGVHVLVFLPSSPGSFAEVGFFAGLARGLKKAGDSAGARELISKSLILLDKDRVPAR
ncbi:MAG: hypothetical protein C0506_15505, partial [Anaerolinea sp.]|nr:hypothetical protein [Anaerolinea sp.]